jgi:hypothetical protein
MTIKIAGIYEESEYRPFPEWIVEEEDKRIFAEKSFGQAGDAWATVFSVQLAEESRFGQVLNRSLGRFGRFLSTELIADELWLRVCSPTFGETDARFRRGGRHLALVQDEFDRSAVESYFHRKVAEVANRKLPAAFDAFKNSFYVFDPWED